MSENWMYVVMTTLEPSVLIGSSLFLQTTRTAIISQIGSKFGMIRLGTAEFAAHRLIMGEML